MTQKILLFNLILTFLLCVGCKKSNEVVPTKIIIPLNKDSLSKEEIYKKIEHFVKLYNFDDEKKQLDSFYAKNPIPTQGNVISNVKISDSLHVLSRIKGYNLNDSLNFYFSKLKPDLLFHDKDFKYLAGKLLEKRYLYNRKLYKKPETFPVYNMSLVTYKMSSNSFALNIISQMERNKNLNYKKYSSTGDEFVCIDTVVLELDKIPQMKNDSIHKICMDLVKNNETGGCKW